MLLSFPFGFDKSTHQTDIFIQALQICEVGPLWLLVFSINWCHNQEELLENKSVESYTNQSNIMDV